MEAPPLVLQAALAARLVQEAALAARVVPEAALAREAQVVPEAALAAQVVPGMAPAGRDARDMGRAEPVVLAMAPAAGARSAVLAIAVAT